MNRLIITAVLFLTTSSLEREVQSLVDPCKSAHTLDSLKKRLIGYKLSGNDLPLCDYYMDNGWYSLGRDILISSSEENCGTVFNWFLNGTLPNDSNLVKKIFVCRNDGEGNVCSRTKEIAVKKCGDNEYVFELQAPDGCPEAYCIESLDGSGVDDTPPDISTIKPVVIATVVRPETKNHLNFYCDFIPPTGTEYFYSVEWGITTGLSWTHTLKQFDPFTYVSQVDFRKKTALTEKMLEDAKFGHLGITLQHRKTILGASSQAKESQSKFFGIEVQNKTIRVSNHEDTTIFLRLTAPFGCAESQNGKCDIDLNVFIPNNDKSCKVQELATMENIRNKCGIKINNQQINEWIPLRLTAFDGENRLQMNAKFTLVLSTRIEVPIHPFFSNYILDPIKVEVEADMALLKNKQCFSHNDPHMGSFDGLTYENQNSGKFLLYRNTKYEVQVQIQTVECYTDIWCNCGVVINAGRDVFIVNHCGINRWDIRFRTCEDAILRRKVFKVNLSKYKVVLPTGTVVTIDIYGTLLNVYIAPGLSDYLSTEELCGRFDGNSDNDQIKRPNSKENDPNLSWRVLTNEDLFIAKNDHTLKAWQEDLVLCSCNADKNSHSIVDKVTCHRHLAKRCQDDRTKSFVLEHQCSLSVRKKRNVHGVYVHKELDLHETIETKFVPQRNVRTKQLLQAVTISQRKTYDDDSAKADCLHIFNTTVFAICSSLPGFDVHNFIDNCILDAKISNSMDWSMLHLEALKEKCLYEVKVNQPLSKDDLSDVDIIVNNTVVNSKLDTNNSIYVPDIPTFTKEVLDVLEEVTCPNECFGNGKCIKGVCACNGNFIGEDCSVNRKVAPIMEGIPDLGECDLQYRECNRTSVFASNIADTMDLTCKIVPFTINFKNEMVQRSQAITTKGQVFSIAEVSCPLQNSRRKRFAVDVQDLYIATGYYISISNDGIEYSEEDILVIFDSECVDCTKNNDKVVCKIKQGHCVKKGQCYTYGDIDACNICTKGLDNIMYWESNGDCPIPVPQPTESRSYWIIAAVICPLIVIVTSIIGLIYYKRLMASKKNKYSIEKST